MPPPIFTPPAPGASLSDILSATLNVVQALNGTYQTLLNIHGAEYGVTSTGQISVATLIRTGRNRVAGVSMISGAAVSYLNDIDTVGGIASGNRIYEIPATHGFYPVSLIFNTGLAFSPGASAVVAVFYGPL